MEDNQFYPYLNDNYEEVEICKDGSIKQYGVLRKIHPMVKTGYKMVQLKDINNIWKLEYQHRLLAKCFIPNPDNKPICDHKDRNKSNNSLDNLRWVTGTENNINTGIPKNNTTGFKGVRKCGNKFKAFFGRKYLGIYETAPEAHNAYINEVNTKFPHLQV